MAEIVAFRLGGNGGMLKLDDQLIAKAAERAERRLAGAEPVGAD